MEMEELQWMSIDSAFPTTGSTTPNVRTSASSESHFRESLDRPRWPCSLATQLTWPHVSGFLPLGAYEVVDVWNRCGNRKGLVAKITVAAGNLRTDMTINGPTMYCLHTGQWSRIQAVPVNATTVISLVNYLLCKSSLASDIAVRDHM